MKGFSMIELLIVLSIFGVLSLISSTGLEGFVTQYSVEGERMKLHQNLLRARQIARTKGRCVEVLINPNSIVVGSYQATPDCSGTPINQQTEFEEQFSRGVTLSQFDTGNPLVFNSRGGTDSMGPSTMVLTQESRIARLVVYPAAGQVGLR